MAYKDSDELKTDERYPLGDYSFRIERSSVPGSSNDKIEAICTDKDGKNARKSIQVPSSTQFFGWYVEANETEATVYAKIKKPKVGPDVPDFDYGYGGCSGVRYTGATLNLYGNLYFTNVRYSYDTAYRTIVASDGPIDGSMISWSGDVTTTWSRVSTIYNYTYDEKTVYYTDVINDNGTSTYYTSCNFANTISIYDSSLGKMAWIMVYGSQGDEKEEDVLIARFAIDVEDAGGDGPGSDWDDPGDYDPDWEPEDPTHTLYVTVTGALSGRHNDPIVDSSYSYIPSDKDTVKDYGCGGDGGHGGGGGAGASTVVVHKFATNQANSKEVIAIARRHGYGSGGGKGGKGGDGCILVYY